MPHKTPEARRAYAKAHYLRTKEQRREYSRAWYAENKEYVIANVKTWRDKHPGARSAHHRSARYSLSSADYARMVSEQNGVCAICSQPPSGKPPMHILHVDHDHATGDVRALLCHKCNKGLGSFRDDSALLTKAAMYLSGHRTRERIA